MKRIVDVYIESISGSGDYSKLELFNDEKIELTSSVQNIQDISKVYTDFTQSFTVPASTNNNSILHHFYQSDVDIINNGWNFNFRIRAKIEIDLVPFRTGTIMLEKANIKNGSVDSYTITFYGDLVSLKDKFGETKLSDLDFTAYDIDYTAANVINRVTSSTQEDVMFPLISSKRLWSYGDNTSTDIKTSAGAVRYSELFPALKAGRIFDAIQAKFDVTFNSQFFVDTNDKWDKLYLWLKNREEHKFITSPVVADIVSPNGQTYIPYGNVPIFEFNSADNTFTAKNIFNINTSISSPELYISVPDTEFTGVKYYVDLYKDGKIIATYENDDVVLAVKIYTFYTSDNNSVFQIKVRAEDVMLVVLNATLRYPPSVTSYTNAFNQTIQFNNPIAATTKTDISSYIPDITVSEFFSGVLKMFNATCYATSVDVFTVEPLDMWYNGGNIFDITEYTDIDSIDVERTNIFKKLSFDFEKSESFMNRKYYDNNIMDREYSNTSITLSNEGSDFTIKLPFESLLMDNKDKNDFQVGYCLTKAPDYKPYIPKPIFLYFNKRINDTLYLDDGSTTTSYSNFNIFSNVLESNGNLYSITFHPEFDVKAPNLVLNNNLYATYYSGYLNNLFNPKCRLVRVKAHFPLSLITKLRLNDRLIIRDKRYIINELKSDITSGEVSLALINDFRPMINDSTTETVIVPSGGGTTSLPWKVPNGAIDTTFTSPWAGTTFTPSTIYTDSTIDIYVPANTNTPTPIWTESTTDNIITDDGYGIVNEEGSGVVVPIEATNTNFNGLTSVYTFNLNQE
jgi:hypothetical protein